MQAAEAMQNSPVHLKASPSPNRPRRDLQPEANPAVSDISVMDRALI